MTRAAGAQITVNDVRGDVVLWMGKETMAATSFIKDGQKRKCGFTALHAVSSWRGVRGEGGRHKSMGQGEGHMCEGDRGMAGGGVGRRRGGGGA